MCQQEDVGRHPVVNAWAVLASSLASMEASTHQASCAQKEKASEQFPPDRGFSLPRSPTRFVNQRLDSYCVEKKEAPESTHLRKMKKPRTGGSGASRVPLGGTSDGVGAITLLAYAFYGSVSGILSLKPISRNVSLLCGQGLKPSVNLASHLVFGNAVAFLDFAF